MPASRRDFLISAVLATPLWKAARTLGPPWPGYEQAMVIDCLDFDIDPKWPAKAKAKGMRVPADEWERKLFFAETEVIGSAEDIVTIMEMAAKLSNADARLMKEAAESSFRGDVEEPDAAAEAPRQTR